MTTVPPDDGPTRGSLDRQRAQFKRAGAKNLTPEELGAWGLAEILLGDTQSAVTHLETAVALAPREVVLANDLAVAYLARATELTQPLDLLRAAEASERTLELEPDQLEAHYNRALAWERFGLQPLALQSWREYLERETDSGWVAEATQRMSTLGEDAEPPLLPPLAPAARRRVAELRDLLDHNEYASVLRRVRNAREHGEGSGSDLVAARIAWAAGLAYSRTGYPLEAIAELTRASACFERLRDHSDQGWMLTMVGENLGFLGQSSEAWVARAQAASLLGHADPARLHSLLADLADRAFDEGLPRVAHRAADFAVELLRDDRSSLLPEALLWRARLELRDSRTPAAREDVAAARRSLVEVEDEALRERLAADVEGVAAGLDAGEDPLAAQVAIEHALAYYERHDLHFDLAPVYATQAHVLAALADEAGMEQAILHARGEIGKARIATATFDQELTYFERAQPFFDALLDLQVRQERDPWEILAQFEEARGLLDDHPAAIDPAELRRVASQLPPGSAVVEFALTSTHLLSWTLIDGKLDFAAREVDVPGLRAKVQGWVAELARRIPSRRWLTEAQALYQQVLGERLRAVPPGHTLFVIPDRFLSSLPFAALRHPETGRFLVEDFPIALAPSLSGLGRLLEHANRRRGRLEPVALFGSSLPGQREELPAAAAEITALASLYPTAATFSGAAATKAQFLASLASARLIHFAGHARNDREHPSLSHLVFESSVTSGGSEGLYAHELEHAPMPNLCVVVLSACNSAGLGESRAGSIAGVARPFLAGGAQAVVATLWNVWDSDAPVISAAFHQGLLQGLSGPQALREAQLSFLQSTPDRSRRGAGWAAFQFIGYLAGEE